MGPNPKERQDTQTQWKTVGKWSENSRDFVKTGYLPVPKYIYKTKVKKLFNTKRRPAISAVMSMMKKCGCRSTVRLWLPISLGHREKGR